MKRIILILALLTLFFNLYSQVDLESKLDDPRRTVFWIKLDLVYTRDAKLHVPVYLTHLRDKRAYSGNIEEFSENLWKARSKGNYIVIGPFSFREQVQLALKVYDVNARHNPAVMRDSAMYYWYLVRLGRYSRLASYRFMHIPAAVAHGTLKDFLGTLDAARYNDAVVIGPFPTRIEAEFSKRVYRQQE